MNFQAQIVLILWLPIALFLFARFSPQRAVIIGFILPWLFLPEASGFVFQGIPDYSKYNAASYGVLLGALIFDFQRVTAFRPSWIDLPMGVWCLVPLVSSMTSGLGIYPGLSAVLSWCIRFGIPYFLGRIYIGNLVALRQLAMGILLGGLFYVPLCLLEVRLGPRFHYWFYGYTPSATFMAAREGSWRPMVFMTNGLAIGVWMMAATLIAIWLWQSGTLKKLWDIPMNWLVVVLLGTFILLRSFGAYFYLTYGVFTLFFTKSLRRSIPLLLLILGVYFYIFVGASGSFSAENADRFVEAASQVAGPVRADSLKVRLDNDRLLSERARERWLFGWGPGQSQIYQIKQGGEKVQVTITDSLWIVAYGQYGAVGLVAFFTSALLPAFCFWLRYPARSWFTPKIAPAAVLSVLIALYMLDCSFNAQPNPAYLLASGGIAGLVIKPQEKTPKNSRFLGSKEILLQDLQKQRQLLNYSPTSKQ